jgi:GH15 family glucan-1,4-alpha-glucosidase
MHMPLPIEDYALIGDCHTAALVGRDGSIDWLCLPRFDSGACFAALLGGPQHGHWRIAPVGAARGVRRHYRNETLILETEFETDDGAVCIVDCMPVAKERCDVVRIVIGLRGRVRMQMQLVIRFDYGSIVPWVRKSHGRLVATAGPDTLELATPITTRGEDLKTLALFDVEAGERVPFVLHYRPSHAPSHPPLDAEQAVHGVEQYWRAWSERCGYSGPWRAAVVRSMITLKALTYMPTGGIVAAPTTSLPEQPGGVRNWDYRFCWLRDATFTLNALLLAGYADEAVGWREWLLRAVAGSPQDLQVVYSVTGERRLDEIELPWLPGYDGAVPVRIGNAASRQLQLDVYGEVMDTLHLANMAGLPAAPHAWQIQRALLAFLDRHWREPDEGIWEIRGPRRHFVHSKVMAWVAFDRAVKAVERFGFEGPVTEWRRTRDVIHAEVCARGFDTGRHSFVQHFDAADLDASVLLIPLVGFLPPDDARVRGTVEAVQRNLMVNGLVMRYATVTGVDHLPPGEGAFLPCTFWLADNLALIGRYAEAEALFERLLALRNDVGLLSEEVDARRGDMRGNFPQALTHTALINTARLLSLPRHKAKQAGERGERPATAEHTMEKTN